MDERESAHNAEEDKCFSCKLLSLFVTKMSACKKSAFFEVIAGAFLATARTKKPLRLAGCLNREVYNGH